MNDEEKYERLLRYLEDGNKLYEHLERMDNTIEEAIRTGEEWCYGCGSLNLVNRSGDRVVCLDCGRDWYKSVCKQ